MILPDWMLEERPEVTKVGKNSFLIRNRHHLEALIQKFETRLCQLHQSFIQRLRFCFSSCFFFQLGLVETLRSYGF